MDSMSAFRASWKVRLVAFGIGILVAAAVFGIALAVSDDLRLLYVSGALLFAVAAFSLGAKAREDLISAVLLLFASTFLFAFFVLPQTPLLWPTLLLWAAIVTLLLFRNRFGNVIRIGAAVALVVVSAWYCVSYVPVQMQRALTHVRNDLAPRFSLARPSPPRRTRASGGIRSAVRDAPQDGTRPIGRRRVIVAASTGRGRDIRVHGRDIGCTETASGCAPGRATAAAQPTVGGITAARTSTLRGTSSVGELMERCSYRWRLP
jgi:hypothetical protein